MLEAHFTVLAHRVSLFELRMVSQSGIGVALRMVHRKYSDDPVSFMTRFLLILHSINQKK